MRISNKNQSAGDSKDGARWIIAGISLRGPLKPVLTKIGIEGEDSNNENSGSGSTTPTSDCLRVAECPPAPRKRRPVSVCCNNGKGKREFYTSPEMDSFFKVALNSGRAKC